MEHGEQKDGWDPPSLTTGIKSCFRTLQQKAREPLCLFLHGVGPDDQAPAERYTGSTRRRAVSLGVKRRVRKQSSPSASCCPVVEGILSGRGPLTITLWTVGRVGVRRHVSSTLLEKRLSATHPYFSSYSRPRAPPPSYSLFW